MLLGGRVLPGAARPTARSQPRRTIFLPTLSGRSAALSNKLQRMMPAESARCRPVQRVHETGVPFIPDNSGMMWKGRPTQCFSFQRRHKQPVHHLQNHSVDL